MERIIAYHCAPALSGIKASNMISCYKNEGSEIKETIEELNFRLNEKGVFFTPLYECEKRVLLLVYRQKLLDKALSDEQTRLFLSSFGYPQGGKTDEKLSFLKKRLEGETFPHEIGAFLGYPINDILGFINHRDEGCLLCGEWRVYENAQEAKKLFSEFRECRSFVIKALKKGQTLSQMFKF